MIPSRQLIDALRRAADRIEAPGSDYDWHKGEVCNCGQVARQLIEPSELLELMYGHAEHGTWSERESRGYCPVTGLPIWKVIKALAGFGFERGDLAEIESTSNQTVCDRAGIPNRLGLRTNPSHVASYLRAQAQILEEQLTPPPPKPAIPQECAHMWLECGVCIFCSATKPVNVENEVVP